MSVLVELKEPRSRWQSPPAKPLDEAVWQAWIAKGQAHDQRGSDARGKAVKWLSIAGLLAAAGLWSRVAPYEVVVRFIVAAGAIAVMLQTLHARQYAFAVVFGALALLYNPVAPVFGLSGDWPRALVVTSAVPFVASLAWRNGRPAHNG